MKKPIYGAIGGALRLIFNISVLAVGVYLAYNYGVKAFEMARGISSAAFEEERSAKEVDVTIPSGSSTEEIGIILHEAGLIGNVNWFRIQSRLDKMDGQYKAGKYTLNTNMSDEDIMDYLTRGAADLDDMLKLTVPEGYTANKIGALLEEMGVCTAAAFRQAMNTESFDYDFVAEIPADRSARLEGYLFPDTYFIDENATPVEIISKMLSRFEQVYEEELQGASSRLSMDESIIRASIIEAEIRAEEERALCASVIQNRLDAGMPLQMDATVLYALGERKTQILLADLEVDSPYNTYKNTGLPVGPIGNPGRSAIRAALNPANTDYIYYVLNDLTLGTHAFTDNYDHFLEAKERYKNLE